MCLSQIYQKDEVQCKTSKNLNKPFYAWKVVHSKTLRPPYRGGSKYFPGKQITRERRSISSILKTRNDRVYECGIHLFLTSRDVHSKLKNMFSLRMQVVKVLVKPQSVVAWGHENDRIVVIVRSCKVCD